MGLLFSILGDACMVYPLFYELGFVAFGVAHCFYIKAYGFRPAHVADVILGVVLYSSVGAYLVLTVMPGLPDLISFIGLSIYFALLTTTSWRALARAIDSPFESRYYSIRGDYLAAIGAALFIISDCLTVYIQFVQPLRAHQILVMSNYYAAQFCIATAARQAINEPKKKYW